MVDEIVKSTKEAAAILAELRLMPKGRLDKMTAFPILKKAVNRKLMLQEDEEEQIRNLIILSIKQQDKKAGNLSDEVIKKQIKKYDCHQTSLVAQKKTLLLMFIERELGITLDDDEAVGIETMEQLAEVFTKHMMEGETSGYS